MIGKPWGSFLRELAPIVVVTGITIAAARGLALGWELSGWIELAAASLVVSLLYAAGVFKLVLTPEEVKDSRGRGFLGYPGAGFPG